MAATLYEVLGASPRASHEELHRAYRRRAAALHPDRHGGDPRAEEAMRALNAAWQVLGDPDERAAYDEALSGPPTFAERPPVWEEPVPVRDDPLLALFARFHPLRWGLAAFMIVALLVIFVATAYLGTGGQPR